MLELSESPRLLHLCVSTAKIAKLVHRCNCDCYHGGNEGSEEEGGEEEGSEEEGKAEEGKEEGSNNHH